MVTVRVREGPVASASLRKDAAIVDLPDVIDRAAECRSGCASCRSGRGGIRRTSRAPFRLISVRPSSASTTASLHFARFLNEEGLPWRDLHLELQPGTVDVQSGGGRSPSQSALTWPSSAGTVWQAHRCLCLPGIYLLTPSSSSPWQATSGYSVLGRPRRRFGRLEGRGKGCRVPPLRAG